MRRLIFNPFTLFACLLFGAVMSLTLVTNGRERAMSSGDVKIDVWSDGWFDAGGTPPRLDLLGCFFTHLGNEDPKDLENGTSFSLGFGDGEKLVVKEENGSVVQSLVFAEFQAYETHKELYKNCYSSTRVLLDYDGHPRWTVTILNKWGHLWVRFDTFQSEPETIAEWLREKISAISSVLSLVIIINVITFSIGNFSGVGWILILGFVSTWTPAVLIGITMYIHRREEENSLPE